MGICPYTDTACIDESSICSCCERFIAMMELNANNDDLDEVMGEMDEY